MKLPIYQILGMGMLAGLMVSCQSEELAGTSGEGYIQLSSVKIDKNVITKDGEAEIMAVDILNADGSTFRHADDWTTLQDEAFLVPAGTTYTVKAYSNGGIFSTVQNGMELYSEIGSKKELTLVHRSESL